MKMRILLLLLAVFASLRGVAQETGGIRGIAVSRVTRAVVSGVKITVQPGRVTAVTDASGRFEIGPLSPGEYMLLLEAPEYESLSLPVRVERTVKEVRAVLIPESEEGTDADAAAFAEFDTETVEEGQSLPSSLSASKDVFNGIAAYQFSKMRFNVRGYDSPFSEVYLNGIRLNDAMTGYTPWNLWSGLNDVTRNQELTSGLLMPEAGIGSVGGTTNIIALPSQQRKGWRMSLVSANTMYRFRGMLTYASGMQDNGWAYAFSVSTRQGGNDYVKGIYYNAYGYFAAVEKRLGGQHRLALSILGAPAERGAQQAATEEVYDLVGNHYYNPNWGWQDGKRRNARVRNYHEPVAVLNYVWELNERSRLNLAASMRFGQNGYSALTWYAGPDPRPDYYRYLPSFFKNSPTGAWLEEAWRQNTDHIRHINWEQLYETNRTQPEGSAEEQAFYGPGRRSINMVEERHADQLDWNVSGSFSRLFRNNSRLAAGFQIRRNRTRYYSKVKDLLGGDYWVDVDKFAERDMGGLSPEPYQNDMDYYREYGHARAVKKGDKFGYHYFGQHYSDRFWARYHFRLGKVEFGLGGEAGHTVIWREGLWEKGLFPDNSKGSSREQRYATCAGKLNLRYQPAAAHVLEANAAFIQDAPVFQYAFVSPRTRNSANPGISASKVLAADASYAFRSGDFKAKVSGYYTLFRDQTKVISYYDDVEATFSNFAMSGIDKLHFGLEAALSVPLYAGLSLKGAVSWGQYTYDSNPDYVQIQDNSGEVKNAGKVYWRDKRVESTPQLAANAGLNYRGPKNVYAAVDFNYFDRMYLSMSPLYRTDAVLTPGMTPGETARLRRQERFGSACVMNASIGKNWYIKRKFTLGFSLNAENLLNDRDIKTGGYEQIRLLKNKEASTLTYEPFDAKYFYMFGTTYYLNVYFRF